MARNPGNCLGAAPAGKSQTARSKCPLVSSRSANEGRVFLYFQPVAVLFIGLICLGMAVAVGGLFLARPLARRLKSTPDDHGFVGSFIEAMGALYGLLLGLVAVAVWSDYKAAEELISREGAAVAAFYNDVSGLREPARSELRALTRDYTNYTIDVAWPAQRIGQNPMQSNDYIRTIRNVLHRYEPTSIGQTTLHAEALHKFNDLVECRRRRVETITQALPGEVWCVITLGALAALALTWLLTSANTALHVVLEALLGTFLGLSFFVILAFDRPLIGSTSVDPKPFELVRDRVILPDPPQGSAPPLE